MMTTTGSRRQLAFNSDSCVHAVSPCATCTACVDICPENAIVMDDAVLGVVESACTLCGRCQAACPQSAISIDAPPPVRGHHALLACDKSAARAYGVATVGCIHSQGLEQLAGLHNSGVRRVTLVAPDCADCIRVSSACFWDSLERFNTLAKSRDLAELDVVQTQTDGVPDWRRWRTETENIDHSRRGFFRAFYPVDPPLEPNAPSHRALSAFQQSSVDTAGKALNAARPEFDPQECVGCDACVNICPEQALSLSEPIDNRRHYAISAARCTGCGLCRDICEHDAISIKKMDGSSVTRLPLTVVQCRACGVSFHRPEECSAEETLCRICMNRTHHTKLFQVLE